MTEKEKQKTKKRVKIFTLHFFHKHHKEIKKALMVTAVLFVVGTAAEAVRQYAILKQIENTPAPQITLSSRTVKEKEEAIPDPPAMDTANWNLYSNPYYGFNLKYPSDWKKPTAKSSPRGSNWQYRYLFRKSEIAEDNAYIGFDVVIYDAKKIKDLANTDEFPELKNQEDESDGACTLDEGRLFENPDYPAKEIYISSNDDCYNTNFFFSLTREEYIYNLVPVLKEGADKPSNPKKEVIQFFPEFFPVASASNLIDIKKSEPQAKITYPKAEGPECIKIPANILVNLKNPPKPVDSETKNGKRVCYVLAEDKKDNPHKSNKNPKGGWGGCCYDPDEVPNPRCCYPVGSVYEKYLNKYFKNPFPLRK